MTNHYAAACAFSGSNQPNQQGVEVTNEGLNEMK